MRSPLPRRTAVFAVACLASLLLTLPAAAGAATSKYPPAAAAGFNGGLAGWTPSSSNEGVCLAPLLCASVENSFQQTGGADGGGYVRTSYTGVVGVTAVGGTTAGIWESPAFAYEGAGGEGATAVSFSLDRRASVDQLLAVAGNSAEYTVRLIDISDGGAALTLIPATTLAGAGSWTEVTRGSIDPASLTIGHDYRIQITSRYTSGTSVLVTGSADYDNVVLGASDGASGNGKGGKRKGGAGKTAAAHSASSG